MGTTSAPFVMGTHNVDKHWVKQLQDNGVHVVPRVMFEARTWNQRSIASLLNRKKRHKRVSRALTTVLSKFELDGVVFEASPLFNYVYSLKMQRRNSNAIKKKYRVAKRRLNYFLKNFARRISQASYSKLKLDFFIALHVQHLPLIDFNEVGQQFVTGVCLMTYDYSAGQPQGGPNSPIDQFLVPVVKQIVYDGVLKKTPDFDTGKLLLGLNFYGYKFAGSGGKMDVVTGQSLLDDFIESVSEEEQKQRKWLWLKEVDEHVLVRQQPDGEKDSDNSEYKEQVWYPTLQSIQARLNFAEMHKMGISIWELGQGLEYFNQLL